MIVLFLVMTENSKVLRKLINKNVLKCIEVTSMDFTV